MIKRKMRTTMNTQIGKGGFKSLQTHRLALSISRLQETPKSRNDSTFVVSSVSRFIVVYKGALGFQTVFTHRDPLHIPRVPQGPVFSRRLGNTRA